MLDDGFIKSFFDTANRQVRSETWTPPVGGGQTGNPSMPSVEIDQNLDGHGLRAKRVETKRTEEFVNGGPQTTITTTVTTTYYVRSSLAGGDIALELDGQGNKVKGYIYALGGRLAEHWTAFNGVLWRHTNPVTGTMLQGAERSEFDPLGAEVGNYDPWVNDPTPTYQELKGSEPLYIEGGDPFNARSGCTLDGLPISCSQFLRRVDNGSVHAQNPNGSTPLTHLGGGLVVGSYHRDAGFADAVATDSNGRSERFPVRVLDQIGFSRRVRLLRFIRLASRRCGASLAQCHFSCHKGFVVSASAVRQSFQIGQAFFSQRANCQRLVVSFVNFDQR
jgi:hypothetical protein